MRGAGDVKNGVAESLTATAFVLLVAAVIVWALVRIGIWH